MKIHHDTLTALKCFTAVNKSLTFTEGKTLTTISPAKSIVARATTPTDFSLRFTVYDLSRFIATASLLNDPDFEFGDKSVVISDSERRVTYGYADESVVKVKAPSHDIVLPSIDARFTMTLDTIRSLTKALGVLGLPHMAIVGRDGSTFLEATDSNNPLTDTFSVKVGQTEGTFRAYIKKENLAVLFPSDYEVTVTKKGMAHFAGKLISFWIALEQNRNFESVG